MGADFSRDFHPSPLDPFLAKYLRWVAERPVGQAPAGQGATVGVALDWPAAFAEAIFVSARTRGLIEPVLSRAAATRNRWQLSQRGRSWLTGTDDLGVPPPFVHVPEEAPIA